MKNRKLISELILLLCLFTISSSKSTMNNVFIPTSNTIAIAVNPSDNYNTSEIDIPKNTSYMIVFINSLSEQNDLTILKPNVYVDSHNCSNIGTQYYDLKLGPISKSTVNGTWTSPNFDTWLIYYNSNRTACSAGTTNLIKVGNPSQNRPMISEQFYSPGFEIIFSFIGIVSLYIIKKRNKQF